MTVTMKVMMSLVCMNSGIEVLDADESSSRILLYYQ